MKQEDIEGFLRQRVTSPSRLVFRSAAESLRYSQASRSNYRGYLHVLKYLLLLLLY